MPSGPKKRKAARKKKESQLTHFSPAFAPSHDMNEYMDGDEDLKPQEDRESDFGELSSPASHEHCSLQNHLTDEGIEEAQNISSIPCEEVLKNGGSQKPNVMIENEDVGEVKFDEKDHDEPSCNGDSSETSLDSGSSNSDTESNADVRSLPEVDITSADDSVYVAEALPDTVQGRVDLIVANSPAGDKGRASLLELDMSCAGVVEENKENVAKEEEVVQSYNNVVQISEMGECVKKQSDHLSTESHSSESQADDRAESEEIYGVTELSLLPAPFPVQITSWKSCCGLFEVFAGPGR